MDLDDVRRAYRRHSAYYDLLFGAALRRGRLAAVERANALAGTRLLEVGVGTGLSLPHYRAGLDVVGIDISHEMLMRAARRQNRGGNSALHALIQMDAQELGFADDSFDVVVATYVLSVAPSPRALVAEIQRVCRPKGAIIFVNHFARPDGLRGLVERGLAPLAKLLGWHPDFPLDSLFGTETLELLEESTPDLFRLFTLMHLSNEKRCA
jgi:phosphatidylethanolamine/phosphatidyl-N-methylethanolamine N-methyltransferase